MSELQNAIYGLKKSPWDKLDSGGPGAVEVLVKAMNKKATEIEEAIQATTVMTGSLTARSAAAAAVRRDLDKFDEAIIALVEAEEEADREVEASAARQGAKCGREQRHALGVALAAAQVGFREAAAAQAAADRRALFGGRGGNGDDREGALNRRKALGKEEALKASADITAGLRSARTAMASGLAMSAETLKELDGSSRRLESSYSELHGVGGAVAAARGLLKKLAQRDMTDRYLVVFAFAVLVLVALYVIQKRF